MTTDPRQCPKCKRMIAPELLDGVPVLKAHGTLVLGRGLKMCPAGLKPIREKRTRLGHQIQKALASKPCGRCGKGEAAGAAGLCRECYETPEPDPFEGFRDVHTTTRPDCGRRCGSAKQHDERI